MRRSTFNVQRPAKPVALDTYNLLIPQPHLRICNFLPRPWLAARGSPDRPQPQPKRKATEAERPSVIWTTLPASKTCLTDLGGGIQMASATAAFQPQNGIASCEVLHTVRRIESARPFVPPYFSCARLESRSLAQYKVSYADDYHFQPHRSAATPTESSFPAAQRPAPPVSCFDGAPFDRRPACAVGPRHSRAGWDSPLNVIEIERDIQKQRMMVLSTQRGNVQVITTFSAGVLGGL